MRASLFVAGLLAAFLCSCGDASKVTSSLPAAPDYADSTQWYVSDRGAEADVFYVISVETGDYLLPDGTVCSYADTYRDSLRAPMTAEMAGVDTLVGGRLNFFSPYYRQCSLQSFTIDSLAKERQQLPTDDVRRAFDYYLHHINNGRPFVLAGFSLGSMIVTRLLGEMDRPTYSRMVAAYAIGSSISEQQLRESPFIRPAQGADDTGVTICYNSVSDPSAGMWPRSAVAINPVNWRTDSTSASLAVVPSPLIPADQQEKDLLTVHLDPPSNLIVVEGYTADDYILPLIGCEGNYHSREIWLYAQQLKENIALRTKAFMGNR